MKFFKAGRVPYERFGDLLLELRAIAVRNGAQRINTLAHLTDAETMEGLLEDLPYDEDDVLPVSQRDHNWKLEMWMEDANRNSRIGAYRHLTAIDAAFMVYVAAEDDVGVEAREEKEGVRYVYFYPINMSSDQYPGLNYPAYVEDLSGAFVNERGEIIPHHESPIDEDEVERRGKIMEHVVGHLPRHIHTVLATSVPNDRGSVFMEIRRMEGGKIPFTLDPAVDSKVFQETVEKINRRWKAREHFTPGKNIDTLQKAEDIIQRLLKEKGEDHPDPEASLTLTEVKEHREALELNEITGDMLVTAP